MKAKQSTASLSDLGAPAALLRLETEELKCYAAKERLEAQLIEWASSEPPFNASDDLKTQWKIAKANLEGDLLSAFKRWDIARKSLIEYDKSVREDRREGEKILVSDAKEIVSQITLSCRLAVEQCVLGVSQEAALAESPADFCMKVAPLIRAAFDGALKAAKKDQIVPDWAVE